MAKNFSDFTYGVGLEITAKSFKQVKDDLKLNLNNLSKMVKSYEQALKIDPNADLSKLFDEMRQIQSIVDGINSSKNSFGGFVDKGTLGSISALEERLKNIDSVSENTKSQLNELKSIIGTLMEPLKAAGGIKFPATFENLFSNFEDQTSKIKTVVDQIAVLSNSLSELRKISEDASNIYSDTNNRGSNVDTKKVEELVAKFFEIRNQLANISDMDSDKAKMAVAQIKDIGMQLANAIKGFSSDKLLDLGIDDVIVVEEIDELIKNISSKKDQLTSELTDLKNLQRKFVESTEIKKSSAGKSLGLQSDYTAQVKVTPKANESEWINIINDTIKNMDGKLNKVHLTPTFSKSKNIDKEIDGNLAQINHTVGVELKVDSNIEKFNKQIDNIDTSIKNAKQRLEQNGNFHIKFEYEEGGNFKDVAYKIINQLKSVEVHVDSKTSANFIKELGNLRTAANKELKNIRATVKFNSFNSLMKSVDTLKAGIDDKLSKKEINLIINNEPEVISKATLIKDKLTELLGNIPVNLGVTATTPTQITNPANVNVEPLSESALKAKENLEKCKEALASLSAQGFNSPWFLELGNIGPDGKKIKDTENELERLLNRYKELKAKTPDDVAARWQELYPEANGDRNIAAKMAKEASEELKKVEAELNGYLQKQIAYTQSRYEQNQKILQQEKEIASTQQKGASESDPNQQLAISADEASKKIRSLNGVLTQRKKVLEDLENNGINSKSLISLGNWDKETQNFKKNKQEIQQLVNRYKELKAAREQSGGTKAVGEEASLRGKLGALLKQQKQHVTEIIAKNQVELEEVRKISAAYKEAGNNKNKKDVDISATEQKIQTITDRLNKAKTALTNLRNGLTAVATTGLGDNKHVLKDAGRTETLKQLVILYDQLIAKKKELESGGGISKQSIQDLDKLKVSLQQAQQVLDRNGLFGLTETGLGDVKGRLAGSSQTLEELISQYRELLLVRKQLKESGDTTSENYTNTVNAIKGVEAQLQVIRQDQKQEINSRVQGLDAEIAKKTEYLQVAKECNTIEGILADVHKNQVEYARQRIAVYQQQIDKEQELLNIARQRAQENANVTGNQPNASTGTTNTSEQDTSTILTSINEKVGNILSKLSGGINITGSNISIEASNVSIAGGVVNPGASSGVSQPANGNQQIAASAEMATQEQQELNRELEITHSNVKDLANAVRIVDANGKTKKETETYKSADKVVERIETSALVKHGKNEPETFEHVSTTYKTNLEAFNKLRADYVEALTKQKEIEGQIAAAAGGPKAKLEAELEIQKEITKNLESQISLHKELYTEEQQSADNVEAERKARQRLAKSAGAKSDKETNKQNNDLIKLIDAAQKKYDDMQNAMNTSKVPMADAAIEKFTEYGRLLAELKIKQQEINNNPELMKNVDYKNSFNSLLQQMKKVQSEFTGLQNSSNNFLSKISSMDDIQILGANFDPKNLEQMHGAMSAFANQLGVGSAKLIEFNDANRTATFEIKNGKGQVQQLTVEYDAATNSLGRYISQTRASTSETQKFISSLKSSFQNVARYVASFGSVYRIFAMINQGFTYVKDIDSALTELKKVTDETDASYNRFLQDMSKTGKVIGATVKDLTTMAAEWARLGHSMQEAGKLAQSTAILMNVSEFDDATKASEALISTMQAFQYTADESERVVDILNEVGNNYAISSDGIATALQDSASALMEGGNNLEKATALVAAANRVIQDPNSVGSALRTISLRLRGTSVKILEEMGEETDNVVESTSKLQEKLKALTGVDILTETGAYKDTYTILKEIGAVWQDLEELDKAAALELMAGKNRANTLSAILNNMDDLENAYKDALNAEGSAMRENDAYLESIQGRVDLFTNAVQTFWMNLISSDAVKGFVDRGTDLVTFADTFIGKLTAIGALLIGFARIKGGIKFADMFKGAVQGAKNMISVLNTTTTATQALTKADIARAMASKGVEKGLVRQIIAEAGLKGVTTALTKEQIKATAAKLSAKFANEELTASQYIATMSTMGLKTALQALWQVLLANPFFLVTAAVTAAAFAFDWLNTTAQEAADAAKEAFDEIKSVVDSTESTIRSLENELSTLQDQIDAFDGKKLSFADEEELKRLKKQKEELEHSLTLQKQLLDIQKVSKNKQAVASMEAYTKAASEGAEKTQKSWKTALTAVGVVLGTIAGAVVTGGASLGVQAAAVAAGAAGFGIAGNKAGEAIGSKVTENDGTYDSWYETYTKAIETAREEEEKALEKYQKDSSNIKKLDAWRDAQQKTIDIETEMYEHLSRMQEYYDGAQYGQGIDAELDEWYNFLDKFAISEEASGAKDNALDRIFGENASDQIQDIRDTILETIKTGQEFDFDSAINGSEELKNILEYVGLTAEDVKNYFTQIGEAAQAAASKDITPVMTYSALVADAESYNEVLKQTLEVVTDNTEVTQEYKDALTELGISSEDIAKCFDENNELIVTNADLLNDLVKSAKNNIAQNTKLAKSQARLKYYELYKKMRSLTNGRKVENAATLSQIKAIYQEMSALQKVIAKYSLLEHQLLGTTNAYDKLADAQAADEAIDYGSKAEELVNVLANAFNTAELGTEAAQVAIAGLVPDSVIDKAKSLDDQMQQIYSYFTTGTISKLFKIEFDDDGGITSVEMTKKNIEAFTESLIGSAEESAVFQGTWDEFTLNPAIKTLQQFADAIGATKEVAFAYLTSLEKYDISWMGGDFTTLLDQLVPSASYIRNIEQQMQAEFDQTPIDLTARVRVSSETMQTAGWDVADGEYSTVHTVTYQASEFGLTDASGNDYAINVTPILPDGTPIKGGDKGLREYINNQIKKGGAIEELDIFLGSYQTIQDAEEAAQKLHELQAQYYDMLENYSIDNDIYDTMQKISELEMKIASGTITEGEQSTYGSLLGEMELLEEAALNNTIGWAEASNSLDDAKNKLIELNEQLSETEEGTLAYDSIKDQINETQKEVDQLIKDMQYFGEPTEFTLEVALDKAQRNIDDFKKANKDDINLNAVIGKIEKSGLEELGLTKDASGNWQGIAEFLTSMGMNPEDQALVQKITDFLNLADAQHTIDALMGTGITTVEQHLKDIVEILQKTYELQVKPEVDKTPVTSFIDWLNNTPISKTISFFASKAGSLWNTLTGYGVANGTANAHGTAYKSGSWGAKNTETALVGELGPELLVRGSRWTTIGEHGAEFTQVKKGDIIFNHKQTDDLLSKGYITGRGKLKGGSAFASGTAYAGINTWDDAYGNVHKDYQNAAGDLSGAADDLSDAADEFNDVVDWVEIRLEEINEQLDLLNSQMENAVGYLAKNQIIDTTIDLNKTKLTNLQAGMAEYENYAAQLLAKVPAQYRDAVQNGMIAINEFTGEANEETVEAINNYREWAQKVADLKQQIEDLESEIVELAKTKFDNVADEYDDIVGLIENANEKLDAQVSLMEDRGYVASKQYYESMIVNTQQMQGELKKEKEILQSVLDEQVRLGNIKVGSDAWYEMIDQLYDVDAAIVECTSDLESYQNAINDIYWDNFDELINRIDYLKDETQSLIDLMDSDDLVVTPETEGGWSADEVAWTDEGIASLGLYAQQMEIAEYKSKQYAKAIDDLNSEYAAGKYSESEYLEKLNELTSAQYDSIEAYYDAQDAIKDLNKARVDEIKNGIEKQIDAYEKLINKKKELLDAEKDAVDFQRSIEESNKEISDIERQIAALSADNSASARAKRAKLQAELAQAQQDLQDKYYDRSVEDQKEALDKELENFKEEKDKEVEKWEEYLEDVEKVLTDSLSLVKDSASEIYDTLHSKADEYNLTLSDSIVSPWESGSLAISDYQSVFDTAMSSTMDQLSSLKAEWQSIIDLMAKAAGEEITSQKKENNSYTAATSNQGHTSTSSTSYTTTTVAKPTIKVGGKINAGNARIYNSANATSGYKQYYSDDPIYKVLAIDGDWIQVRHHKLTTGVTGWFKKGHVNAYAKGTKGVKENQLALIDELGDELVMHADGSGKLAFLSKGSAVIPHDISENLMQLGELNPQDVLDRNRPVVNAPHITNNNIELNVSFGEVVHIDHVDNNAVPNLAKTVEKQIEKYMKGLNAEIRKFTR